MINHIGDVATRWRAAMRKLRNPQPDRQAPPPLRLPTQNEIEALAAYLDESERHAAQAEDYLAEEHPIAQNLRAGAYLTRNGCQVVRVLADATCEIDMIITARTEG